MAMMCVYCKDPLGEGGNVGGKGEIPVIVTAVDKAADDPAGREVWCPQCFCYARTPREAQRFSTARCAAVHCAQCGKTSLDYGMGHCSQCQSSAIIGLPPKGRISTPGASAP